MATGLLLFSGCFGMPAKLPAAQAAGSFDATGMTARNPMTTWTAGMTVMDENPGVALSNWTRSACAETVPEGPRGETCLRIRVPGTKSGAGAGAVQQDVRGKEIAPTAGRFESTRALDVAALRGWRLTLIAHVRTTGVPPVKVPWEGVRMGLDYARPLGPYSDFYYGHPGESAWHDVVLDNVRIPDDATEARLGVGLISTAGTIWIDSVRLILAEPPLTTLASHRAPFVQTTQRRGAGIATATQGIVGLAREWKLNVVKWWFRMPALDLADAAYGAALEAEWTRFDSVLRQAEEAGIRVILQVGAAPEGAKPRDETLGGTDLVYLEVGAMNRFVASWQAIARRYVGRAGIEGYDLLNETVIRVQPVAGCLDWEGLAERTAQAINVIDPKVQIFVQPEQWWGMSAFTKLRPIHAKNITYSAHMYAPFPLTHQGISERASLGVSYPATINGQVWDKEALRNELKPARDFQLAYGVPIQVGEFSCIRWAPNGSQARWLKDCIDLFEEYGWDWTYHALWDWDGWSPDYGEDPKNLTAPAEPVAARKVLLAAFARNPQRPVVKKLIFIGNSITRCGPSPDVGWTNNWGMAASTLEKDYAHRFQARLSADQGGSTPETQIGGGGGGALTDKLTQLDAYRAFGADLAIVQMGENDKEVDEASFQRPYERILQALKDGNPQVRILCTGAWAPTDGNPTKDAMIRDACRKFGAVFVDMSAANADAANMVESEKRFTHGGVNWHPGDRGMQAYADALWLGWTDPVRAAQPRPPAD